MLSDRAEAARRGGGRSHVSAQRAVNRGASVDRRVLARSSLLLLALACLPAGAADRQVVVSADAVGSPKAADDMSWWSVDGGGGTSSAGTWSLTGVIGQPEVGTAYSCWHAFDGGLWSGAESAGVPLFCDGFESGGPGLWSSAAPAAGGGKRSPDGDSGGGP